MKYGPDGDRKMTTAFNRRGRKDDTALTGRLQAAMIEALAGEGFDAVRLEDIAAHIGTSKQAIYRRWDSKEAYALDALRQGLLQVQVPLPERANAARDLYRLVAGYRAGLSGPLGPALLRVRAVTGFAPLVEEFEDDIRFHVRQCLIATPFDRDLDIRASLVLGFLWQDLFDRQFGRGGFDGSALESAIYLLLGLVAPRGPAG